MTISTVEYRSNYVPMSDEDYYGALVFHREKDKEDLRTWDDLPEDEKRRWRYEATRNAGVPGATGGR